MVGCPFNIGDTITLKQQYVIVALLEETQKYWLLEATQIPNQMTVMIKIYINNKFSSITEAEKAWKKEISILQSKAGITDLPVQYIESGSIVISGEKLFFIVLNYIEESKQLADTTEEQEMVFEDDEALSGTHSIDGIESTIKAEELEKEKIPQTAASLHRDVDDFEPEKKIPSKPSAPKSGKALPLQEPKRSKRKEAVSEFKEMPEEPKGISFVDEKDYLKHISMEYFDRKI